MLSRVSSPAIIVQTCWRKLYCYTNTGGSGCSNDVHYCHCGIAIVIAIVIDIVTSAEDSSEPVGKEQCCRQQNMNYVIVALTAQYSTNCSQFFIHNFDFRVNLTWSCPGLGA